MRIGILGSGLMGGTLGTLFARAGHDVVFSYARSEQKLKRLAREALGNARAGTPSEAARDAEALLLAVHWSRMDDVLKQAGDLAGKVIITCSLPMNADDTNLVIAHTSSGAEALAKKVRKAAVVAAFGTVPSEVLFSVFEAKRKANRPSLVYCSDAAAKQVAATLIRDVGFDQWTLDHYESRATWSRSRCWWDNWRTRGTKDPRSRTAFGASESRRTTEPIAPS
jgi:8-hydroxy-5-deazaflavin:NADPH oxidoreductase